MLSESDLKKTVDKKFWKHITKDSLINSENGLDRDELMKKLVSDVNGGFYIPSDPREIVIYSKTRSKENRIARLVPLFQEKDYVLVYFLLTKLEKDLSKDLHPNAFGAFRNFKVLRDIEKGNHDMHAHEVVPSPVSSSSFYKWYWLFEWKEFLGKSRIFYESNRNDKFFIQFDIADFYHSIDLNRLEGMLRAAVPARRKLYVDLLIHFLKNWNKRFNKYVPHHKGIPQDEVGDLSRVLANFYLRDFDHKINSYAESVGARVLRYSDDHIIFAPSENIAAKVLFYASIELQKIGLCINGAKVNDFPSRTEFKKHWAFSVHSYLDRGRIQKAAGLFISEPRDKIRWDSCLLRFINFDSSKLKSQEFSKICSLLLEDSVVCSLKSEQMIKLYKFLPDEKKVGLLRKLNQLSSKINFNSFHYNLLNAIEKNKEFRDYFNSRRKQKVEERIKTLRNRFVYK